MIESKVTVSSEEETRALAHRFMETDPFGKTVGLSGPLGAGKTTFVRYCAEILGMESQVSSPSYVLQHLYTLSEKSQLVEHWDLYRLSGEIEEELFEPVSENQLRFVEWPERMQEVLPYVDLLITITVLEDGNSRIFSFGSVPKQI